MTTMPGWLIDNARLTSAQLNGVRAALIVGGLAAVILGILVWAWPGATVLLVGWAFGLFFIVSGIVRAVIGLARRGGATASTVLTVALGVLLVVAGVVVLGNPGFGVVLLASVVGIILILEGVAALSTLPSGSLKWLAILYGAFSIIAGVLVVLSPGLAAHAMLLFAASLLIAGGILQTLEGIVFGRGRDRPTVV